jgi:hypothetical protein
MAEKSTVEVSRSHGSVHSIASNGSTSGTDYYTTVVKRQTWADVPENGIYAGREYKITEAYISQDPGHIGQLIGHSSSPWSD